MAEYPASHLDASTILCLCGIPGAGKSTLAQHLLRAASHSSAALVCFDAFQAPAAEWDELTFHVGRAAALQHLEQQLEQNQVVVVDDTMHLRSMRREVYALGRARGVPVVVIWLRAPLALALARNSTRVPAYQVEESAIGRIHTALEPPDGSLVQDRCFLVVDADSGEGEEEEGRARSLLCEALALAKEERPRLLQRAAAAAAALSSPSSVTAAEKNPSPLQALELRLRQLTALILRALPMGAATALEDRRAAATALSAAKKLALASARRGQGQGQGQGARAEPEACVQDCAEAFVEAVAAALPGLCPEARAALFCALGEGI